MRRAAASTALSSSGFARRNPVQICEGYHLYYYPGLVSLVFVCPCCGLIFTGMPDMHILHQLPEQSFDSIDRFIPEPLARAFLGTMPQPTSFVTRIIGSERLQGQ